MVAYRDYCDTNRFEVLGFTEDIQDFKRFVSELKASGGGDAAEDVFGGLAKVLDLEWQGFTRVLFHVADAPCHGKRFHTSPFSDDHEEGDPDGRTIEQLLPSLNRLKIQYIFNQLAPEHTDQMVTEFNEVAHRAGLPKIHLEPIKTATDLMPRITALCSKLLHTAS